MVAEKTIDLLKERRAAIIEAAVTGQIDTENAAYRNPSRQISNVWALDTAEFHFYPGFNLIVGANGVGKTTVLEAISRGLAQAIQKCSKVSINEPALSVKDIRHGAIAALITLDLEINEQALQVHEQRNRSEVANARPGEIASEVDVHAQGGEAG